MKKKQNKNNKKNAHTHTKVVNSQKEKMTETRPNFLFYRIEREKNTLNVLW